MPDIPDEAVSLGAEAVSQLHAKRGWAEPAPWWAKELSAAILEAAAPILAGEIASAILRYADENEPSPGLAAYLPWHRHFEAASAVAAKAFGRDNLEASSGR